MLAAVIMLIAQGMDLKSLIVGSASGFDIAAIMLLAALLPFYVWGMVLTWNYEDAIEAKQREEIVRLNGELDTARSEMRRYKKGRDYVVSEIDKENFRSRLLRRLLAFKWQRVRECLAEPSRSNLGMTEALAPREQISLIVRTLHELIKDLFGPRLKDESQLRVAYFEPIDGTLQARASWDGVLPDCVASPNSREHSARFAVRNPDVVGSLAAWCFWHGDKNPIIIPDTSVRADIRAKGAVFEFFNERQRATIRSIAVYACRVTTSNPNPCPVIVIDTDQVNFFSDAPEYRRRLRRVLEDFAMRLLFERDLVEFSERIIKSGAK